MIRDFNENDFVYILLSAQWTIGLSAIAFVGGGIVGAIVAILRISPHQPVRLVAICYIRLFQSTPLLLQLFIVFFLPTMFGVQISPLVAAALGLILNAGSFLGEIWRGCLQSVPKGQWEAAQAVGLRYLPVLRLVIVPQAVRISIPPTVGYLVQLVKATSLAAIIGFTELTRAGQILINSTFRPFLIFSIIAVIYFLICWPLSLLSARLERRIAADGQIYSKVSV